MLAGQKNRAANKITNLENKIAQREELISLLNIDEKERTNVDKEKIFKRRGEIGATDNLQINESGLEKDKASLHKLISPSTQQTAQQVISTKPVAEASKKNTGMGFKSMIQNVFGGGNKVAVAPSDVPPKKSSSVSTTEKSEIPKQETLEQAQRQVPGHMKDLDNLKNEIRDLKGNGPS